MTDGIDIHATAQYLNGVPHEQFAILRREAPVWWQSEPDGPGYWAVVKHADVVAVSKNPKRHPLTGRRRVHGVPYK